MGLVGDGESADLESVEAVAAAKRLGCGLAESGFRRRIWAVQRIRIHA